MASVRDPKLEFRMKLYQDPDIRTLLSALVAGQIQSIAPFPDPTFKTRYPSIEKMLNLSPDKVEAILRQLADSDILTRELFSIVATCPSCDSFRLIVHPLCPMCKSRNLTRSEVYEHITCGYVGLEQTFWHEGVKKCPKCHGKLEKLSVDYRIAGIYYQCMNCKKSFDIPTFQCSCQECNTNFFLTDATFLSLYTYIFNKSFRDELLRNVVSLDPVKKALSTMGFTVEAPGYLPGASGVKQRFDITARHPGVTARYIVMDIVVSETEVLPESVLSLFAKGVDVKPDETIILVIPRLREDAKALLPVYKIKLVEGNTMEEAVNTLKGMVKA